MIVELIMIVSIGEILIRIHSIMIEIVIKLLGKI